VALTLGVAEGVADCGVGLGVGVDETLGEAVVLLMWTVREITTPAATAAPTNTTAPTMIKIPRRPGPDDPEPCPPDPGEEPPLPPGPLVPKGGAGGGPGG
jgi:hypothetical protein